MLTPIFDECYISNHKWKRFHKSEEFS